MSKSLSSLEPIPPYLLRVFIIKVSLLNYCTFALVQTRGRGGRVCVCVVLGIKLGAL